MRKKIASDVMRTTIDIAAPIHEELLRIKKKNGGTMGELVNGLLAEGLKKRRPDAVAGSLEWTTRPMRARVDLEDKEAVNALLGDDGR